MKTHQLDTEIWLPAPLEEVFEFFSDAGNLEILTLPWLKFEVQTPPPIGMSTLRESLRLVQDGESVRMVVPKSDQDWIEQMVSYSKEWIEALKNQQLRGYILKKDSPLVRVQSLLSLTQTMRGQLFGGRPAPAAMQAQQFSVFNTDLLKADHSLLTTHRINQLWSLAKPMALGLRLNS